MARSVHDETGVSAPVSAFVLARACGLRLVAGGRGGASLRGGEVHYDVSARPVRQHGLVAHEVAHYVLRLFGEDDPEPAVRYTAGALMLPRRRFDADLRDTAWDLEQLRRRHPNASAELIARRIAELRDAVVTILDHDKVRARVRSPWQPPPRKRLLPIERELADAALQSGEPQYAGELLAAYPLIDGIWRRVIVVACARQLGLRL